MTTTAYRSVIEMRRDGFFSETVEHRLGQFVRKDLFGIGDTIACKQGEGIILIQAYLKKDKAVHDHMNSEHPMVKMWLESGGRFWHHIFDIKTKNKRKRYYLMDT